MFNKNYIFFYHTLFKKQYFFELKRKNVIYFHITEINLRFSFYENLIIIYYFT